MELKPISDTFINDHLHTIDNDGVDIFILDHGNYRGALINGTKLINQMRTNHQYGKLETFIAGHAYLAAGLLTSNIKGNDRIELKLICDGPVGGVCAEATAEGRIRGYLENSDILELLDENDNDKYSAPQEIFDMSPFIGEGSLAVTKKLENAKNPFTGFVSIEHGNIAQDLTYYFIKSEQKPTAFNLSIRFDSEGRVIGAGGLMVQAFPSAEYETSYKLDSRIRTLTSLGTFFSEGQTGKEIIDEYFSDVSPVHIGKRSIEFYCHCSKDLFKRFLSALPVYELRDLRDNGPFPVKTTCFNCNTTYEFSYEEVEELYQDAH